MHAPSNLNFELTERFPVKFECYFTNKGSAPAACSHIPIHEYLLSQKNSQCIVQQKISCANQLKLVHYSTEK
jgi:hypothetical protein